MKDRPVIANDERRFSAHHILLDTAEKALNVESPGYPSSKHGPSLTAITLSALALEALLNAIGDLMVEHWEDFDRLQPKGKLRFVAKVLNVNIDLGKQPWQDFIWLFRVRNEIAHAKPEVVKKSRTLSLEQFNDEQNGKAFYKPESSLEAKLTLENGWRAVKACRAVIDVLALAVPSDKSLGISGDTWSGAYAIAPEHLPNPGGSDPEQ
jgi:hypothetical protein